MRRLLRVSRHPLMLARFGAPTVLPAATLACRFATSEGRELSGGIAAHAFRPLHYPMSAAIGLGTSRPATGTGGRWRLGTRNRSPTHWQRCSSNWAARSKPGPGSAVRPIGRQDRNRDAANVTMFDLDPYAVADILGDRLPSRVVRAYRRFRHGPGAFKVDFAVDGGVPWTNPSARRAATVHAVGTFADSRPPSEPSTPAACRSARSCWSGSSIWPTRSVRSATSTPSGRTHMCPAVFQEMPPRRSSRRSSALRRGSVIGSSDTPRAVPPRWPPTTPTMSAVTS